MFDRVTDESINVLIHAFYAKVRHDPQLGPIFNQSIGNNWDAHMSKMCDFWNTAMRISRRYTGDMLTAHRRVSGLRPPLFEQWLALFEATVAENFTAEAAAALCDRARKTAYNLRLALFHRPAHGPAAAVSDDRGEAGHARDTAMAPTLFEKRP